MVVHIKVRAILVFWLEINDESLDGLMSYSIPQGDTRGYHTQFFDESYDGKKEQGVLKGQIFANC